MERYKEHQFDNGENIVLQRPVRFCQAPSEQYMIALEEAGYDPRSVAGIRAIKESGFNAERGWKPTWDARDQRV